MRIAVALIAVLALAFIACSDDAENGIPTAAPNTGPPPIEGTPYTTARGVEITVFATGSEEDPSIVGDAVSVHYTGWLADGTTFDSSLDRGNPFTFVLGRGDVILGWDDGILGMSPGDQRRLIIPADLAYGDRGFGNTIPPGATLTFYVELIGFGRRATPTPEATG